MTEEEFEGWQHTTAVDFANALVDARGWDFGEAYATTRQGNAELLPYGLDTPGMFLLVGLADGGVPIGRLWIGLEHPRGVPNCAFLYDIEVDAAHRGQGLGRELLAAGEAVAAGHGARAIELNVFGSNATAISLYQRSGYRVSTQQMIKDLG
ncbi:GNAT family N-acetyltransferase [Actinoplanes utahensis]|nr:GNAT family N-acetyltransferase [Actinoplanes utahensis]